MSDKTDQDIREQVRAGYAKIAETGVWLGEQFGKANHVVAESSEDDSCSGGSCCGGLSLDVATLAEKIGYTEEEVKALPEGTNMGLSCGNPNAIAALKEGEVVIDLGSGGGFDAFLSGPKVGDSGQVIGIDMTPEMISKARNNTRQYIERTGLDNVTFRLGEIEHLPVADHSVDVIISNCVINLSPDKQQVFLDMFRVLQPGGRVAISDMVLLKPLPDAVLGMVETWVGCVSGAALLTELKGYMEFAGFEDIELKPKPEYVATLSNAADPLYAKIAEALPEGGPADYISSMDITAVKRA